MEPGRGAARLSRAGICKQSMGARNRVRIGLSWPAGLHRLAESIPWNRFLGSIKFKNSKFGLCTDLSSGSFLFAEWGVYVNV